MKTVAIVQARMTSTRLPGKVLLDIERKPLLWHLIQRLRRTCCLSDIILATSIESSDLSVCEFAEKYEIKYYRGSLYDVLDRHYQIAMQEKAKIIVRVPGDTPLVEPILIDRAVDLLLQGNLDYVSAKDKQEIPKGFGNEVIRFEALKKAWEIGKSKSDREHVTWYILSHRDEFKLDFLKGDHDLKGYPISLVVDTPDDLKLVREIFKRLYKKNPLFGLRDVIELYQRQPDLFSINEKVKRNPGLFDRIIIEP